ncbi:MAG: protein kinase [Gemmatimonadales bacterium]|nr:protein kinase [Gemmatimonadales bacterium]NIN11859.1 protein kinase [Gemmatimonadales bacterium]NIN50409.1 protein kinase [Gemmatimonadales bacterium]NIP07873.1 protein kinase [Gemmatimonadales bacterium]NIR02077.1 protein kinase [Gemmatimonadales bacterium]
MAGLSSRLAGILADRYRVGRELGRGGMAVVYLARDLKHDRRVALKVLRPELAASLGAERFLREIRIAAKLSHPHIVPVYDSGEIAGMLYYVMPHVEGESLRTRLCRDRPLPLEEAVRIARGVVSALTYAHSHGVIHRDIKPDNILLPGGEAVVTDFGIARAVSAAGGESLTLEGLPLGTLGYMSPEQETGSTDLDERTDVYSLGCVLYEMLVGERPGKLDRQSLTTGQITAAPPEHRQQLDTLPYPLERVLVRALAPVPADRFGTAADFAEALASQRGIAVAYPATSIAVLPFANMSSDTESDYFADGIADEITSALAKVRALRVASRTSAFAFKRKRQDIRNIGQYLGVGTVLEGSVRKAGSTLRITAQLINVADGYHLWSESYDRELEDVFAIQDEIARNIAEALQLILSEDEKRAIAKAPTADVKAYDYYLRGRQFFRQSRKKSLEYARQMFDRAIQLDPEFALAYAGVADCWSMLNMYYASSNVDLEQADVASRKALELEPESAEAHGARGFALFQMKRHQDAELEFETAIRLDPKQFEARYHYARACFAQGKLEQAARLFEDASRVREDYQASFFAAQSYAALGNEADAEVAYRRALGVVEQHLELNPDDPRAATMCAVCLCRLGEQARGLEWAERAVAIDPEDAGVRYNVACLYALEGEAERAIDCLEQAFQTGFGSKEWIEHDPDLDSLRSHPRFQALLAGV